MYRPRSSGFTSGMKARAASSSGRVSPRQPSSSEGCRISSDSKPVSTSPRSEEHTSELQSRLHLVCRLLLEKKKKLVPHFPHYINRLRALELSVNLHDVT